MRATHSPTLSLQSPVPPAVTAQPSCLNIYRVANRPASLLKGLLTQNVNKKIEALFLATIGHRLFVVFLLRLKQTL